ncbi:MAG: RidA family protein [Chloroflexi bacterium]|nr:MAG: RidA family protein [Chloroflexota bacterium]
MKTPRNPDTIHAPRGRYIHQIEVSGENRLLFLSGQLGMKADGSVPPETDAQLGVALENVLRNLEAAGFEPGDLVKVTTYVVGDFDPDERRAVLDRVLGNHLPTSTLVFVAALARPEFKVEVDAWAIR